MAIAPRLAQPGEANCLLLIHVLLILCRCDLMTGCLQTPKALLHQGCRSLNERCTVPIMQEV